MVSDNLFTNTRLTLEYDWDMDIRRAALATFVASVLNLLISTWGAAHKMAALASMYPGWLIILGSIAVILFDAILPVFYFALHRDQGTLRLSRELRLVSLTAALMLGASAAIALPHWIASLGQGGTKTLLMPEQRLWTMSGLSGALTILGNAVCMFLMITLYRWKGDQEEEKSIPSSKLLKVTTRLAVIGWGACMVLSIVRLVHSPYDYAALRDAASQNGRILPPYRDLLVDELLFLLVQAGLFAGPYVIWRASSRQKRISSMELSTNSPNESTS
jgi:hypothetical protein